MTNPVAVVTGATGGIGSAVVQQLTQQGYTVLAFARHEEPLRILQEANPRQIFPVSMDVGSPQSVWMTHLIAVFDYYDVPPQIDVLVCAHGFPPVTTPSLSVSFMDEFAPFMVHDVGGSFLAAQAVAPYMIRQSQGSIVFVSSLHAHQTYPARAAYAAAKAGVCAMARSLALEWGPLGITVNTVLPWQVDGRRSQQLIHQHEQVAGEDLLTAYQQRSPQRRLITEDEVAQAVLALIQNRACNGTELILDGGVSASMWHKPF